MNGPSPPDKGPSLKRARVYIVDDHSLVRVGLKALLETSPDLELCGEAEDFETALRDIERLRPDVAIVDLSLKDRSGMDLVKSIRALKTGTRICIFSVHDESIFAVRALKAGASGYLMKQQPPAVILEAVRKVARGQKIVSDLILQNMLEPLRASSRKDPVMHLSDRELEIATWIGLGTTTREIAARLQVSVRAVEVHRTRLKKKLNLRSGTDLLRFCCQLAEGGRGSAEEE